MIQPSDKDIDSLRNTQTVIARLAGQMADFFTETTEKLIEELTRHIRPVSENAEQKNVTSHDDNKEEELLNQDEVDLEQIVPQVRRRGRRKIYEQKPAYITNKPKTPMSSYLLFLQDRKQHVTDRFNITNMAEINKLVSEEWKELGNQAKDVYYQRSLEGKVRYRRAMEIYKHQYADDIKEQKRKKRLVYKKKYLQNKQKLEEYQEGKEQMGESRQIKIGSNYARKKKEQNEEMKEYSPLLSSDLSQI